MLATAKAAGPRHGDRLTAPRRHADSVVDETDAPIGLPRYLAVQTKLTVGSRDDPLEREADALAHAARHSEPARDTSRLSSSSTATTPSPRRASADVPAQAPASGATHSNLLPAEGASPLSSSVRSRVEPILDADLSSVQYTPARHPPGPPSSSRRGPSPTETTSGSVSGAARTTSSCWRTRRPTSSSSAPRPAGWCSAVPRNTSTTRTGGRAVEHGRGGR